MNNIRKILVPLDFSENSRFALDWAMSIADKLGTKVVLFHACEIPARFKEATGKDWSLYNDVLMDSKRRPGKTYRRSLINTTMTKLP